MLSEQASSDFLLDIALRGRAIYSYPLEGFAFDETHCHWNITSIVIGDVLARSADA
jgi:hypothetical protein